MAPTFDRVIEGCAADNRTGLRRRALGALYAALPEAARAAAVWVADLLYAQLGGEAAAALLAALPDPGATWAYVAALAAAGRNPCVTVTGGRYAAVAGAPGVFDLEAGAWLAAPPRVWYETRVFNVGELVRARTARLPKE